MIDDESLMHINDSIFFMYVENAVKWRKLTVTEAAEEYNFWLNNIKAQAWEEGFDAGERDVHEHELTHWDDSDCIQNPYREENK